MDSVESEQLCTVLRFSIPVGYSSSKLKSSLTGDLNLKLNDYPELIVKPD